jgi:hypothetical protein
VSPGTAARGRQERCWQRRWLNQADTSSVSADVVSAELAWCSPIPVVAGASTMEGADLVHTEAQQT